MSLKDRVPIPGYSSYTIDLVSTQIYNKHRKKMSTFLNKKGFKQVNLVSDKGSRKSITVEPLVLKLIRTQDNRTAEERIAGLYLEYATPRTVREHWTKWATRICIGHPEFDKEMVSLTVRKIQLGK